MFVKLATRVLVLLVKKDVIYVVMVKHQYKMVLAKNVAKVNMRVWIIHNVIKIVDLIKCMSKVNNVYKHAIQANIPLWTGQNV